MYGNVRVVTWILKRVQFEWFATENWDWSFHANFTHISTELGLARPTVHRTFDTLCRRGILALRGHTGHGTRLYTVTAWQVPRPSDEERESRLNGGDYDKA